MRMRAAVAVLMVMFLPACAGGDGEGAQDVGVAPAREAASRADAPVPAPAGGAPAEKADADDSVAGLSAASSSGDTDSVRDGVEVPVPDTPPITTGERIIKEGTISIEVKAGEFDAAFDQATHAAARYGGDVVASSTRTDDEGNTSGSVTVRVPVQDFEEFLTGVGEIGTIVKRDVGSTDVTAEFTDLESRLRHLQALERFYLGLLDRAEDVRDAIAVQQQVEGIQSEIEKIQGRLNVLDDRTTYSTLTVELFEQGLGGTITEEEPETRPTLARYWETARDAFVNVVGALMVAVLFMAPVLVIGAIALLVWMVSRRRLRQPAPPPPAAEERDEEPATSAR